MGFIGKLFNRRESESKNPQLVESVRAVIQNDSPQTRQMLCSVFQRSTLIMPTVRAGKDVLPMLLKDPEGNLALPVFSDPEAFSRALREWGSNESLYTSVQGTDL